jgi:hypothetical protein
VSCAATIDATRGAGVGNSSDCNSVKEEGVVDGVALFGLAANDCTQACSSLSLASDSSALAFAASSCSACRSLQLHQIKSSRVFFTHVSLVFGPGKTSICEYFNSWNSCSWDRTADPLVLSSS